MTNRKIQFKTGPYHHVPAGTMRLSGGGTWDTYRRDDITLKYDYGIYTKFKMIIERGGRETTEKYDAGVQGTIQIRSEITSGLGDDNANIITVEYFTKEIDGETQKRVGEEIRTVQRIAQLNKDQVAAYAEKYFPYMCMEGNLHISAEPTLPSDVDLDDLTREVLESMKVKFKPFSIAHRGYFNVLESAYFG